jgi:hypothetical protein
VERDDNNPQREACRESAHPPRESVILTLALKNFPRQAAAAKPLKYERRRERKIQAAPSTRALTSHRQEDENYAPLNKHQEHAHTFLRYL